MELKEWEENIENCNLCDTAEKLAELPVFVLAKFSKDLLDMAKENWCESHIIMLRRLIIAVQQGTRYDETLLPEEAEHLTEIVKGGGVTEDVCEWKSAHNGEFIQNPHTKRLYSNEPSMKNIYCNTCGKKIKAVEQMTNEDKKILYALLMMVMLQRAKRNLK